VGLSAPPRAFRIVVREVFSRERNTREGGARESVWVELVPAPTPTESWAAPDGGTTANTAALEGRSFTSARTRP
ncbi:MAG TPA: hypothetical protein VGK73_02675, partial [Polyangiaceae bacterium]